MVALSPQALYTCRPAAIGTVARLATQAPVMQGYYSQVAPGCAESPDAVDLPAGSYTGGVTNLTAKAADQAAEELPAVAFT